MKKTFLKFTALAITVLSFAACTSNESTEEEVAEMEGVTASVTADTAASEVIWKGDMLGLYSHEGTVKVQSGSMDIDNGVVTGGNFVVDLTSINPTDDGYDEERTAENLVGHLSSDDFFNVEEFPTASFEVTGAQDDKVMGNLTIRGKTNPETVENVMITEEDGNVKVSGELTFDRTKYDVNFKMPVEDKVLSNDITLNVKIVGNK